MLCDGKGRRKVGDTDDQDVTHMNHFLRTNVIITHHIHI